MLGWLVAKPLRHVTLLSDLTNSEAAGLGPLLQRIAAALQKVLEPAKVYSLLFAEQQGFSHIHFHLIPRAVDLPSELHGPAIFQLMQRASVEGNLADPIQAAAVAARIREAMA
jgi:diadenosine tetraphosphate (Ap4A) HIT family hydrolase